jgi:hypothetical protein
MSAIGIPSIVSLAKLITNAKYFLSELSLVFSKINEIVTIVQRLIDNSNQLGDLIIEQSNLIAESTLNKKAKLKAAEFQKKVLAIRENNQYELDKLVLVAKSNKNKIKVKVAKKGE